MEEIVVDNSVIIAWCFEDEANEYVDSVLDHLRRFEALVPSIWPLEFANVLLVAERKKRISESIISRIKTLIQGLPIRIDYETRERIMNDIFYLAKEYKLSSYDASYLDLAMKNGLILATQDKALIRAAKATNTQLFKL